MVDVRVWLGRLRLRPRSPVVPVVRLSGVIGAASLRGGGLNLGSVNPVLERAFKVRGAKAVALAINSPGGSPVQSALIAGQIRALSDEKKLPVLAFIEDVGASGGYWLALAADEIFADPSSIVGSIGVIHASFGFAAALERLGIERRLYTAGSKKSMLDPFRPQSPEDVERRGERLKGGDEELFEGQIWTGRGALEAGLIDGLGSLHTVLKVRFGDKVKLPQMSAPRPWWQRRLGLEAWPRALVDAGLDSLAERALWSRYGL